MVVPVSWWVWVKLVDVSRPARVIAVCLSRLRVVVTLLMLSSVVISLSCARVLLQLSFVRVHWCIVLDRSAIVLVGRVIVVLVIEVTVCTGLPLISPVAVCSLVIVRAVVLVLLVVRVTRMVGRRSVVWSRWSLRGKECSRCRTVPYVLVGLFRVYPTRVWFVTVIGMNLVRVNSELVLPR